MVTSATVTFETLFPLGQILATPNAMAALAEANSNPIIWILKHAAGDWGELDPCEMKANADALKQGGRILSAYSLSTGVMICVITEATDDDGDRKTTMILLPEEY
jgi:hypothetical protein